jgi:hypothetical protein
MCQGERGHVGIEAIDLCTVVVVVVVVVGCLVIERGIDVVSVVVEIFSDVLTVSFPRNHCTRMWFLPMNKTLSWVVGV